MTNIDLQPLRAALRGRVLGPGDWGYDQAREAWNKNINHHPAIIDAIVDVHAEPLRPEQMVKS